MAIINWIDDSRDKSTIKPIFIVKLTDPAKVAMVQKSKHYIRNEDRLHKIT